MTQLNQRLIVEQSWPVWNAAQVTALKKQLDVAENDAQRITNAIYARHPDVARKRMARTVTWDDLAAFVPADTALLDYVEVDQHIVLFCATVKNGISVLKGYPIGSRDRLVEFTDDFRAVCADPQQNYHSKAKELYDLLIAPAAAHLVGKKRLLVCPDGPLWGLPFQALRAPGAGGGTVLSRAI